MTFRGTVFLCLCLGTLAGCAGKPEQFIAPNDQIGAADVQRIYLATDRVLKHERNTFAAAGRQDLA